MITATLIKENISWADFPVSEVQSLVLMVEHDNIQAEMVLER